MRKNVSRLISLAVLAAVAACRTSEGTHPSETDDVWVKIYDGEGFDTRQDWFTLNAPGEWRSLEGLPGSQKDWNGQIESIQVGPGVRVLAFSEPGFRGEKREFGPSSAITDLDDHKFGNRIQSMKVQQVDVVNVAGVQ
jgi:hypothetical protein